MPATAAPPGLPRRGFRPGSQGFHPWLTTAAPPGLPQIVTNRAAGSQGFHPWLTTAAPPGLPQIVTNRATVSIFGYNAGVVVSAGGGDDTPRGRRGCRARGD